MGCLSLFIIKIGKKLPIVLMLVFFVFTASSCTPLKKKFVRQNRDDSSKVQPILDPIDYVPGEISSIERYRYFYSIWNAWQGELVIKIDKKGNEKSKRRLIKQMIFQVNEMSKWVVEDKQEELLVLVKELEGIEVDLARPFATRNQVRLKNKLLRNSKKIRMNFRPALMDDYYI